MEVYNPEKNIWSPVADMHLCRRNAGEYFFYVVLNNKIKKELLNLIKLGDGHYFHNYLDLYKNLLSTFFILKF